MNNWCLKEVTKVFDDTKAIDNISIDIEANKIYGLIGRNGAGKTTLLKLIANQLYPTSGEIIVGDTILRNSDELTQKVCLAREVINTKGIAGLKLKEIFKYASLIYPNWDNDFYKRLIKEFNLNTKKKYIKLSKGMQTMVGIIIGLASRAPVTLFDEPYVGLDPVARELFYDIMINDYDENPRTIIISTHLINELENLFERIIIINEGRLLLNEEIEEIKNKARIISGDNDKVEKVLRNKKIIYKKITGRLSNYTVFDTFSEEEIDTINNMQLDFNALTLQKLFVNLSKGGSKYDYK